MDLSIDALAAAGLPLSSVIVQDETTDPNNKLGRPNQYTSRSSADVPGGDPDADKYGVDRGRVVEVFRHRRRCRRPVKVHPGHAYVDADRRVPLFETAVAALKG